MFGRPVPCRARNLEVRFAKGHAHILRATTHIPRKDIYPETIVPTNTSLYMFVALFFFTFHVVPKMKKRTKGITLTLRSASSISSCSVSNPFFKRLIQPRSILFRPPTQRAPFQLRQHPKPSIKQLVARVLEPRLLGHHVLEEI